jgi:hypothetical protein
MYNHWLEMVRFHKSGQTWLVGLERKETHPMSSGERLLQIEAKMGRIRLCIIHTLARSLSPKEDT